MKILVVGGGPAGMMAAITAAKNGNEVILLEKMEKLGKKLLITGKGRCNITNSADIKEFYENIPRNPKFLYSAFNNFNNEDIVKFLEEKGVKTKVERGGRIFPVSDKAQDVLQAFKDEMKRLNIQVKVNTEVKGILINDGKVEGAVIKEGEIIYADKIILATGGQSYPVTGSTGDGYLIAKNLGHKVTEIKPSLIPMLASSKDLIKCQEMQGLSLRNVAIKIQVDNKTVYSDFGEMLFTHYGVSGPTILSASAVIVHTKNIENLLKENRVKLVIDLKPALDEAKLDDRILRDFSELKNKSYKNSLDKLLPKTMIPVIIKETKINPDKKVNEITKQERKNIIDLIKNFTVSIKGFRPINEAIVTSGGIDIKDINPKTMESKIINGLHFAGEIIDVDAYTGGFNLQIAYSTGYTAGNNIVGEN